MSQLVKKALHSGLAILLSLWVAGAGCMFGCGEMFAAQADSVPQVETNKLATIVSGDACAAHGSHDCCAKRKAEASQKKQQSRNHRPAAQLELLLAQREALNHTSSTGTGECPLALSRAIAITKVSDRKELRVASSSAAEPITALPTSDFKPAVTPAARLPNRGHTYLRCCVFQI